MTPSASVSIMLIAWSRKGFTEKNSLMISRILYLVKNMTIFYLLSYFVIECFKEKSLQALAMAIPPEKAKILGRELDLDTVVLDRLQAENDKDIAEFVMRILVKWKQMTESRKRLMILTDALCEIDMKQISAVVTEAHDQDRVLRASDFRSWRYVGWHSHRRQI